jgi:glutamyl-tRNA synthetase
MAPKITIRTRFAPSPTGNLHIGGVRTALFNYLFAKKNKGQFILRIEDTDKERSKPEFEKDIINTLKWLGVKWNKSPVRQSERTKIYRKYLEKLLSEKKAYYCFCSPEELEINRKEQQSRGLAPKYSGKCLALSDEEVKKNLEQKKSFVIRFKISDKIVEINDLIRGKVSFNTGLLGDIVIAKNLDTPIFHFSNVVDDYEMKISHVIRGEEHLPNTPRHILLQEALGFSTPQYAHIPLILAPDRSKLSKRHGAVSAGEYKKQGYLPEALINFLAFLGWNPGTDKEIFSLKDLIKEFSLEKIQKAGAIFNIQRLDYLNGLYIRQMPIRKLTKLCQQYVPKINEKAVSLYRERLKMLSEIVELTDFLFKDEIFYDKNILKWKDMTNEEVSLSIDKSIKVLSSIKDKDWKRGVIEKKLLEEAGEKRGNLLWPLRVALSGKKASAPPFEIAEFLGKEKTLKRLENAKKL